MEEHLDKTTVNVDALLKSNYRAFLFVVHRSYGTLLLHCTRKAKKGPHYQLPGGHVDEADFLIDDVRSRRSREEILVAACRMAAARELFEETGIHITDPLARIQPKTLRRVYVPQNESDALPCEYKKRLFFSLEITDEDFPKNGDAMPMSGSTVVDVDVDGTVARLKLSHEHSGFVFDNDMGNISKRLKKHSGGACSIAVDLILTNHEQL
mmetsp:Transcript_24404/g.37646  ORF Transcript_24404/g.37646 Transcript_24404/m.37646 type:complete len:210 (-) Transcript_24404:537-1166(-)|eukprot:CAMPEP_0196802782 /NCGR_PEP_ID=MMETSP1362-20130617/2343_1 /TAXON_ID=163516 /ORGANISM="Leptocylindrus danicus, Strain CCMP1856" /LENGTH=209 /DNA_ID=CAMNT_0042174181 /DNA_START=89 /DNA_END=718 /DNA_ORIENTATION=+